MITRNTQKLISTSTQKQTPADKIKSRASEDGSALVYILIAVALLAALTFTFMEPSSQQTSSQSTLKTITGVSSQINQIRSSIQECVLSFPKGDNTISTMGGSPDDPGARKNYPINPDSDHYATATPGKSGDRLVRNIRCPGDVGGANVEDHNKIFVGSSGKYLPPASAFFNDWQYYNGTDGIFFWTETDKTDAFLNTAMGKLDDTFAECEVDVIDATGAAENLDAASTLSCPSGSSCLRVWMITNGSAVYNGDNDGDEAGCP